MNLCKQCCVLLRLGVTIVTAVMPEREEGEEGGAAEGETIVRLLLLPSIQLDTPLPLRRAPTQPQVRACAATSICDVMRTEI